MTVTPAHTTVTVTSTSGTALAANEDRVHAVFVNDSNKDIWLNLSATAVANTGILLTAHGGSLDICDDHPYLGVIAAIHASTGNKTLLVTQDTVA